METKKVKFICKVCSESNPCTFSYNASKHEAQELENSKTKCFVNPNETTDFIKVE